MPNLKLFKRRSSGSNALDSGSPIEPPPGGPSFRVLERPNRDSQSFHGAPSAPVKSGRTFQSPLQQLRGKSADDLGLGANRYVNGDKLLGVNEALKRDRGSGGTTNSGSSGYYESSSASARHSSSSTLPSSVDAEREQDHEELYPRKVRSTPMYQQMSASANREGPAPPTPSSFKSRAARTFSFGQKHNRSPSVQHDVPPLPTHAAYVADQGYDEPHSPQRDRSTTTSSYASTAKPPEREQDFSLGVTNFGDDFGNDFGNMFSKSAGRSREDLPLPPASGFHRTESEPMYPPRALSRQAVTPSPNGYRSARDNTASPYGSHEGRDSQDGLMSSSALSSPRLFDEGPPISSHTTGIAPAFLGKGKSGYSLVPERNPSPGFERHSSDDATDYASDQERSKEQGYGNRQTQLNDGDRWGRNVDLRAPQHQNTTASASNKSFMTASSGNTDRTLRAPAQATAGASRAGAISPASEEGGSIFGTESISTTPRAPKLSVLGLQDESLFDSSPQGPPSRAFRPGHSRTESTPRKMTKAQFEAAQRSGDNSLEHSEEETHEDEDYDDGDDVERAKRLAMQRRKQEATMAVYRQKMKKSTAGGPADLPAAARPSMDRAAASAPVLHLGGIGGAPPPDAVRGKANDTDEDEDVPLGVLQAHGFPSSSRPPTRLGDGDRRMSLAGSVANGGAGQGNLPPFARRLPQDPYFGSSLVNPANRESLAFSSAQSVYGGAPPMNPQVQMQQQMQQQQMQQPQMAHPGGLVGVIASEERAKASRRGSPNPITGGYGMPLPGQTPQMPQQMPAMPRTMSMGSMVAPQVYTSSGYMPGMPPMPQMPGMMPGMQGMPGMPQVMPQDQSGANMQQFMQMQMQLMQNMLTMQQQQLGQSTPQPQQQTPDYLGVPLGAQRPMSMASQAPTFQNGMNQGRAMTMMSPPPGWDLGPNPQRPTSAMPNGYAPSGLTVGGPGAGYTPSIAPSERSNVGMPSRYRPVQTGEAPMAGRSQSMTSSMTLQAFTNQQGASNQNLRPESRQTQQNSTVRLIDKPKGTPKVTARPVRDEDEDDGWAEMAKKRTEKKFGWRKKDSKAAGQGQEQSLSDLYKSYE